MDNNSSTDDIIRQFMSITGTTEDVARFHIEAFGDSNSNNNNDDVTLEMAIEAFYESMGTDREQKQQANDANDNGIDNNPDPPTSSRQQVNQSINN